MARSSTETRDRILKAARMLYSTHGCGGTTLDDILTASGISKGAFYHYFKSKESLFGEVLDEVVCDYEQLFESVSAEKAPMERLRQVVYKIAQLNSSGHWVNCRFMLRLCADTHQGSPEVQRKIKQFWQWYAGCFEELIEDCRRSGQLSSAMDSQKLGRLVVSFLTGSIALEHILPSNLSLKESADVVIEMLRKNC